MRKYFAHLKVGMKVFMFDFLSREDKEMTNMAGRLRRMPPRDRAREVERNLNPSQGPRRMNNWREAWS